MDVRIRWLCLLLLVIGGLAFGRATTTDAAPISPERQYYPFAVHFLEKIRTTLESPSQSAPLSDTTELFLTFSAPSPALGESSARSLPPPHPLVDLMSFQR